ESLDLRGEAIPIRSHPASVCGADPNFGSHDDLLASAFQTDGVDGLVDTGAGSRATLKLVKRAILGHFAHRILDVLRGHFRKNDDVLPLKVKRIVLLVVRVQERDLAGATVLPGDLHVLEITSRRRIELMIGVRQLDCVTDHLPSLQKPFTISSITSHLEYAPSRA
ncbi:MAG: hypothetical protein ABI134_33100, partial [Byssovorax sp.]